MAEIAATGLFLQIADVGLRLSVGLLTIAGTFASAESTIMSTSKDVSLTSSVLKEVGGLLEKDQGHVVYSSTAYENATNIAAECHQVFEEIERILQQKFPNIISNGRDKTKKTSKAIECLKWPYWERKMRSHQSNLERLKSTLLIMLHVITLQGQQRQVYRLH